MMCLGRFIPQVEQFKKLKIFIFGDYEFLTDMFGLSGASDRYPCFMV